jgi:hypothetical protein
MAQRGRAARDRPERRGMQNILQPCWFMAQHRRCVEATNVVLVGSSCGFTAMVGPATKLLIDDRSFSVKVWPVIEKRVPGPRWPPMSDCIDLDRLDPADLHLVVDHLRIASLHPAGVGECHCDFRAAGRQAAHAEPDDYAERCDWDRPDPYGGNGCPMLRLLHAEPSAVAAGSTRRVDHRLGDGSLVCISPRPVSGARPRCCHNRVIAFFRRRGGCAVDGRIRGPSTSPRLIQTRSYSAEISLLV